MKYRYYCSICILLMICLLFGCKSLTEPNSSVEPSFGDLSIAQIYNIIKDYDYWHWSFDGSVKAFKGDEEISFQGESRICDVQYVDGWIYYVKEHDDYRGGFDICRIRLNSEDSSVFFNSAEFEDTEHTFASFNSLAFVDGYMYIQASLVLYQYNILSKTVKQIGLISNYHITGSRLYFIDSAKTFTIYVENLETEETEILLGDGIYGRDKEYPELYYSNFIFIGEVMYYTKRNIRENDFYLVELYRYENGESTLIDDELNIDEYSLFEHDGKLYYIVRGEETNKLMQYNPKDENITEILMCKNFSSRGKIVDGYFYYLDSDDEIQRVRI